MNFKAGDKVRCIDPYDADGILVLNDLYVVEAFIPEAFGAQHGAVQINGMNWLATRFNLVTNEPKPAGVQPGDWLNSLTSAERKEIAMARALMAYFPDALALIARHSFRMNEKHNPGQSVHWSRDKSNDHDDCVSRHSANVAVDPDSVDADGAYHIICRGWRSLAAIQVWAEQKYAKGEKI